MPTELFNEFRSRVEQLTQNLLPAIKEDLNYAIEDYDHVRAYVLLVHAEIEDFLEQRILKEVENRIVEWETNKKPSVVLMGLLAFRRSVWCGSIDSLEAHAHGDKNPTWSERDIKSRLGICRKEMHQLVKDNNGIKSPDVLALLLRVGFSVEEIEIELIGQLHDFGGQRGKIAHNNVRRVNQQPDPVITKKLVAEIVERLEKLDGALLALV